MRIITDHWIWQNTLSTDLCQQLIKTYFQTEKAAEAEVEVGAKSVAHPETRVTNVCWINPDEHISTILMNFALRANNKTGWNLDVDSIDAVQIAEYLPGGHYTWHADTHFSSVDALNTQRKLSVVALLSSPDDYEGGGLELNRENTNVMPNGQGSVYVFPSILEHRVLPVTSGVRYSLTGWCRGPAFR
jgi:PKHD-type hydroxylase